MSAAVSRQGAPSSDEANLILIALEPEVETFRFAHLLQQLTPDVWIAPQGVRPTGSATSLA